MSSFQDSIAGRLLRRVHWLEDGILSTLLLTMILLAVGQILMRNMFDGGLIWGDALLRVLVLWVALAGAMVASRKGGHIAIDIISPWVPFQVFRFLKAITHLFTIAVSGTMAYISIDFIKLEQEDGSIAFAGIPVWVCELIIPIAFMVITLRFFLSFILILTTSSAIPQHTSE